METSLHSSYQKLINEFLKINPQTTTVTTPLSINKPTLKNLLKTLTGGKANGQKGHKLHYLTSVLYFQHDFMQAIAKDISVVDKLNELTKKIEPFAIRYTQPGDPFCHHFYKYTTPIVMFELMRNRRALKDPKNIPDSLISYFKSHPDKNVQGLAHFCLGMQKATNLNKQRKKTLITPIFLSGIAQRQFAGILNSGCRKLLIPLLTALNIHHQKIVEGKKIGLVDDLWWKGYPKNFVDLQKCVIDYQKQFKYFSDWYEFTRKQLVEEALKHKHVINAIYNKSIHLEINLPPWKYDIPPYLKPSKSPIPTLKDFLISIGEPISSPSSKRKKKKKRTQKSSTTRVESEIDNSTDIIFHINQYTPGIDGSLVSAETDHCITINDIKNNMSIILYKIDTIAPKNQVTFQVATLLKTITYAPRVSNWFTNPQKALKNSSYKSPSLTNTKLIALHNFGQAVDQFLPLLGIQTKWDNADGSTSISISIPGEIQYQDNTIKKVVFSYGINPRKKIIYHRFATRKEPHEIVLQYWKQGYWNVHPEVTSSPA